MERKPYPPDEPPQSDDSREVSSVMDAALDKTDEHPTAAPPEPYDEYARKFAALSDEEARRALTAAPVPDIPNDYDDCFLGAHHELPIVDSRAQLSGPHAIPLDLPEDDTQEVDVHEPWAARPADRPTPTIRGALVFDAFQPLELSAPDTGDPLDLADGRLTPVIPPNSFRPPSVKAPEDPLVAVRDRYAVGDFTGALELAETVLASDSSNREASRYIASCRDILVQMYSARLGSTKQIPRVIVGPEQLRWLTLDHRSGFLLSCVDGYSTIEEVIDVSGMPLLDTLRILHGLLQQRIIELRPR